MANPLQIQNESKLIQTRILQLFVELKGQYERGEIKSRTEYLYEVMRRLRTFYESIGKPTMQLRLADRVPSSRDYNDTLMEIMQDLEVLYDESQHIVEALETSFEMTEIDRRNLDNQLKRLEDAMKNMEVKMSQKDTEVIYREGFIDQSGFDVDRVRDNPAHVWTREGVLTLQPRIAENYTDEANVAILKGNGLPGNTKQVRSISGELKFVGEDSLHINLADILDGNGDTWFEYESFEMSNKVKSQIGNLGLEYTEGVKWTVEQGTALTLTLTIDLPVARTINWFSLNPFIPNDKGASAGKIVSIEVHDGKGDVYRPLQEESVLDGEKVYLFGRRICKRIVIAFIQPNAYETEVGHLFYKELEQQQMNYMDRVKYQSGKRIYGTMPSVENLGVQYDHEAKSLVYPSYAYGDEIEGLMLKKQNLFMLPRLTNEQLQKMQAGFENLSAWRYVIGLRDIGIANYQFESSSEFVSKPFVSANEITGVSLITEEEIPREFSEGDWIRYSISPDDGQNWYRILPRGIHKSNGKLMYLFNTNTPKEGRIDPFGYVDLDAPVHSIRLRIEMERPENIQNATYYTPIVKDYQIHLITKGDE